MDLKYQQPNYNPLILLKHIILTLIISLFTTYVSVAQDVYSSELIDYVESELGYGSTVNTFGSEWIQKVTFYSYEGSYIAIAFIKENEYSFRYRKYVFCGISSWNKSQFSFKSGYNSWGQAFHDFIMPYRCNCR